MLPVPRPPITGLILAGGLGRRMGGVDKGLQPLQGKPLVAWSLAALQPQVDEVLINANQHTEAYAALGCPVVADEIGGFAGPLAGLHGGLGAATHDWVVTVPCDSPFLPADLVDRLWAGLCAQGADLAIARAEGQRQPVFCLCPTRLRDHLANFLAGGGRKMGAWCGELKLAEVDFEDQPLAFRNINTQAELTACGGSDPA